MLVKRSGIRKLTFGVAALLAAAPAVYASDLIWDGSVGNWNAYASWLPGGFEPRSFDNATIGSGQVTVDRIGERVSSLYISHPSGGTAALNVQAGGVLTGFTGYLAYEAGSLGDATVTGVDSRWSNSGHLYVGSSGAGTLSIEAGGYAGGQDVYLGRYAGAVGTVTVTGFDGSRQSLLGGSDELFVGYEGAGFLNVVAGARASNRTGSIGVLSGSTGDVTVTGSDSIWYNSQALHVGDGGTGTLDIEDGGRVTSDFVFIGTNAGSSGTVNVTGTGSTWEDRGLIVGNRGAGTLNIMSGAIASSEFAEIGHTSGTVSVTDSGSLWEIDQQLVVGRFDQGTLRIANGGTVESLFGTLGSDSGGMGLATITGPGSSWTSRDLYVGFDGTGTLSIEDGGAVQSTGEFTIGSEDPSTGNVVVTGNGSSFTANRFNVGDEGTGSVVIQNGASANTFIAFIGNGQNATGTVTVTGPNSIWTNTAVIQIGSGDGAGELRIEDGGVVETGNGILGYKDSFMARAGGTMTVTGPGSQWRSTSDLTVGYEDAGVLNVEHGGHVQVGNDLLLKSNPFSATAEINFILSSPTDPLIDVARNASLGGDLHVELAEGVYFSGSREFTLIDIAGTRWGTFDNVAENDLLGSFNGVDLFLTYLGGDGNDVVAYTVGPEFILGDLNGDDLLNNADIAPFVLSLTDPSGYAATYPALNPDALGDFSRNGILDNADIAGFVAALTGGGASLTQAERSQLAAVPEPGSLVMLGLLGLLTTRRQR